MDVTTRNRTQLKAYFVKNSIPTESNFAELIDGMLNQKDDGFVKLPGNPLTIEAAGDSASEKKALTLFQSFGDADPAWTLSLNPRRDPKDAATAKLGLNISDGEGNSRLFIDRNTGNIGLGTVDPGSYKLKLQTGDTYLGGALIVTGNVGIGATDPRGFQVALPESNKSSSAPSPGVTLAGGPQGNASIELRNNGSGTPYLDFAQSTTVDYDARLRLTEPGKLAIEGANLGIGAPAPEALLHIHGSGGSTKGIHFSSSGTNGPAFNLFPGTATPDAGLITFGDGSGWKFHIGKGTDGGVTKFMTIQDNGNVGIGTARPGHRLTLPNGADHISLGDNIFINGFSSTGRITNNAYITSAGTWGIADVTARATTIKLRDNGVIDMYGTLTAGATDWRQMFGFSAVDNVAYFPSGRVSIGTTTPDGLLTIIIPGRGKWVFQTDGNLCYYGNNGRNWCATSSTSNLQL